MKITEVHAHLLSCPMPQPIELEYYGGRRTIYKRDAAFVAITTDRGLIGYGPAPASEKSAAHINRAIRDALVGEDPRRVDALRTKVLGSANGEVALSYGGVEIALYDLLGKAERCPVYQLLGGKVRDRIQLYGSAGMYQTPAEYAQEAAAVVALGFSAYKLRPACGPEQDLESVQRIREAVGPHVGIMVDAHTWWRMGNRSYSPGEITKLARAMAPSGITWLEEPLPPEQRADYQRLRASGIVPIAAGEHETSLDGFFEIIHEGVVDIVQADTAHHGGYASVRRIIEACAEHGRQFAFHNWGTVLEALAEAHLGACFSQDLCSWLEFPCYRHRGQNIMYAYPLADEILREPLPIEAGHLVLPDRPGLGIDIDPSVIEKYPFIKGPWSIFRLTSPAQEWAISGDHAAQWEEKSC